MLPTALKLPTAVGMPFPSKDRSPSGWVARGATLDLDFLNDRSSVGGVERSAFAPLSFARSTVASYYDVNGVLQWAAINTPRIDYHPITHKKLGFLSEQAVGNYCRKSNDFSDALWNTKVNVTLTAAAATGPDGTASATKVEVTATAPNTILAQTCATAGNASGNAASVYMKKGSGATDGNRLYLYNETTGLGLALATLNFDTGVLTVSQGIGGVQALPNGWYRVWIASLTGISASDTLRIYAAFTSNNPAAGAYSYVYGAQLERQVMATSYFPADATISTRGQDICDVACSAFGYSATEGTLMARFKSMQGQTAGGSVNCGAGLYVAGDSGSTERCNLYWYAQTGVSLRYGSNGRNANVSQWDMTVSAQPPNTFARSAVAWRANDIAFTSSGANPGVDALASIPAADRLAIGRGLDNTQYLNGHVSSVTYWPARRSNAELVALTSYVEDMPLENLLFANGEDGFLFGDFSELDELFQSSIGTPSVSADGQTVGLALDDHGWGGLALAQILSAAPEQRGNGVVALIGSATAATYDTVTGMGAASRVDISNQSYISIPTVLNGTYLVDFENTGSGALNVRPGPPTAAIHQTIGAGVRQTLIVQNATSSITFAVNGNGVSTTFTVHSVKFIPGNTAAQITSGNRPVYKANAGKPYLLFDGLNDSLISSFYPMVSGSGLTLAVAVRSTNIDNAFIGGGNVTGEKRALIGMSSGGQLTAHWGTAVNETVTVDRRNSNLVLIMTGDATSGRTVWLNGVDITALFAASVGSPDGTGGAMTLGGRQNTVGGGPDRPLAGNMPGAVVIDRRLNLAEIAFLTTKLQGKF